MDPVCPTLKKTSNHRPATDTRPSSQDPSSIDQPWFQNGTCDPFHPVNQTCTLGNLVSYSVNLSSAADVQASLKFAEQRNLRIVIKNTGHE
jgi:hypothetical protein